jgi:hypothetical protein
LQLARLSYESTVIHEIGHGIGIDHHKNGIAKFTDTTGVEHEIKGKDLGLYVNKDAENAESALARLGVLTCAMRYNFQKLNEFRSKQILTTRQTRYCRANEKYVDDYGNQQTSDNCFGQITVK